MAVGVVTYQPNIPQPGLFVKYVADASPSLTPINCGFVPRRIVGINATDKDVVWEWTEDMADDHVLVIKSTGTVAVTSNGIKKIQHTDPTNHGFSIGTNSDINEASKTYNIYVYR